MSATIIITRPRDASARLAVRLDRVIGHSCRVIVAPVIEIVSVSADTPKTDFAGYIFTSVHGVSIGAPLINVQGAPCWCVGRRTAKAARAKGFAVQQVAPDAETLLVQMTEKAPSGAVLHLRGRHVRGDLAAQLAHAGIQCDEAVVYDQVAMPLSDAALAALGGETPVILPLYSPRSAALVVGQGPFAAPLVIAAMSEAVAQEVGSLDPARLAVAKSPDGAAMLKLIAQLAETTCPTPTPLEGPSGAG